MISAFILNFIVAIKNVTHGFIWKLENLFSNLNNEARLLFLHLKLDQNKRQISNQNKWNENLVATVCKSQ